MNDTEKIKNALEVIEKMIDMAEKHHEQDLRCWSTELEVLNAIKKILVPEFDLK